MLLAADRDDHPHHALVQPWFDTDVVRSVRDQPTHIVLAPEPSHLDTFEDLCRTGDAVGDLVNDAYLAAITVELGANVGFAGPRLARFEALDWRRPG